MSGLSVNEQATHIKIVSVRMCPILLQAVDLLRSWLPAGGGRCSVDRMSAVIDKCNRCCLKESVRTPRCTSRTKSHSTVKDFYKGFICTKWTSIFLSQIITPSFES